jgi:uncharacterized membrane protein
VVEYAVHWLYETFLGVRFWDYSGLPGNLHGRVCLPFSFIWGLLTALAVRWVQPVVAVLTAQIPPLMTYLCLLVFTADAVTSAWVLLLTGDTEALQYFSVR